MTKNLYVVCGASGSGKNTLVNALGLKEAKSYTSRPRRTGEVDTYYFVSQKEFLALPDLLESTCYFGNFYGITRSEVNTADIIIVDIVGVFNLRNLYHERPVKVIGLDIPEGTRLTRCPERESRVKEDTYIFQNLSQVADVLIGDVSLDEMIAIAKQYIEEQEAIQ